MSELTKADFQRVADACLLRAESLVPMWLPGGKREIAEWNVLNPRRSDKRLGSFKINLKTGAWGDFSCGDGGGDLVALYAYIHSMEQGAACRELARTLGISLDANAIMPAPAQAPQGVGARPERTEWEPMAAVPADAPAAPKAHIKRGLPEQIYTYRSIAGELLGYIYRFVTSDGGKETLPLVFAKHRETGAVDWRWMQFAEPRPLYIPGVLRDGKKVLIVEGEKCADAAHLVMGDRLDVVSWPGGCKATSKADWSLLAGREILIWPDADSQREKLSKEEKAAGISEDDKPYLARDKQPGYVAAEQIGAHLVKHGCSVKVMEVPVPGEVKSGWDVADAIESGLDYDGLRRLMAVNRPFAAKELSTPPAASASHSMGEWRGQLITKPRGGVEDCYQNVYLVLKHHPEWQGVIAYDEFAQEVVKLKPTPFHTPSGKWEANDDRHLGLWLAQRENIVIKGDGPIAAGVSMVAHEGRFHPVRQYLDGLIWDGKARLHLWLSDYLAAKPAVVGDEYLAIAGARFLIGAVARMYQPGCKMDTMLVFEGKQGKGKSTAIKILGGSWFSDSALDLSNKDCYMALNGVWFQEIGEMDAFSRAESTRVKAFITSPEDKYREPYERREIRRPRQVVFTGTTNQDEYLKDMTGNRRFWPIRIVGDIDLTALRDNRDQLFAEAVMRFKAGEPWHLSKSEEHQYFIPEQDQRAVDNPWVEKVAKWLETAESTMFSELTATVLLEKALGVDLSRESGTKAATMNLAQVMKVLGYEKLRSSKADASGYRPNVYVRITK